MSWTVQSTEYGLLSRNKKQKYNDLSTEDELSEMEYLEVQLQSPVIARYRNISITDPDPPDPNVFWPSGSISQRYGSGSGSFYYHAKIV